MKRCALFPSAVLLLLLLACGTGTTGELFAKRSPPTSDSGCLDHYDPGGTCLAREEWLKNAAAFCLGLDQGLELGPGTTLSGTCGVSMTSGPARWRCCKPPPPPSCEEETQGPMCLGADDWKAIAEKSCNLRNPPLRLLDVPAFYELCGDPAAKTFLYAKYQCCP